jgi:hypothetical protein
MSPDELAYYRERAFIERQRASNSTVRPAADIHLELAALYERRVEIEDLLTRAPRIVNIGYPQESDEGGLLSGQPLPT